MDVGLTIGVVGILVGLGIAYWQYRQACRAKAELAAFMRGLPDQVVNRVSSFLKGSQGRALEFYDVQESAEIYHTRSVDLDGDGEDELLVQHPFGLHNAALEVFKANHEELQLVAKITADTMAGFLVDDFDEDGRMEVQTLEVSVAADLPYVCGFRDLVWFRLELGKFQEVKREALYTRKDLDDFKKQSQVGSSFS